MGKFRSKLKGQTKGKRWPKGQSSSSNPETKKYRDLAKSRFFQENLGPSNLTSDALRKHDALSSYVLPRIPTAEPSEMDEDPTKSEVSTYKTMQTFASDWSECSNASFSRLLHVFKPDSALHKEMLAVLAAVTEVIKQNGGTESSTEYYAALMTTLEVTHTEMSLAAVLSLLNMGIKSVPNSVLRAQFAHASRIFIELLEKNSASDSAHVLKSLLGLLAALLRAQEAAAWASVSTLQMFGSILAFTCHTKPKVRKAAQGGVCAVLKASCFMACEQAPAHHPAAAHVAHFCVQQLEAAAGGTAALHTLALLQDILHTFPRAPLKVACEAVLQLMTRNHTLLTARGLQALHALFSAPAAAALSAPLNGQLISALYEFQPSATDTQATSAWLATLCAAHVHLSDVAPAAALAALPRATAAVAHLWLSERPQLMSAATHTLNTLLDDCVGPHYSVVTAAIPPLEHVYSTLRACLGYQYSKAWHLVLHVVATAFRCAPSPTLVGPMLQHLAELRDSYQFSYNNELEFAVGAAVKALGPGAVLSVISLAHPTDGGMNLERSWLLPVLKDNVHCASLEYFATHIVPLATGCESRARQLARTNDAIGAHSHELLHVQLWSLLPSFCKQPTDVRDNFKAVAKLLGSVITDRKELRLFVMTALRKLIQNAKENEDAEEKTELGRFAKNYLPILFNLYTTKPQGSDEEGQRLAALETVKEYLTVAPVELTEHLFKNALDSLKTKTDSSTETFAKESILDLIRCLAIYQSSAALEQLYTECIKNFLDIKNRREQKKAYRLLEEICSSEAEGCRQFVTAHRKHIQALLVKTLGSAAVPSRAARLRCHNYLIRAQRHLRHDARLLRAVLPEAVLCCKDINEKCRSAARSVLVSVGETLERHQEMGPYAAMLLAGLAGTPDMVQATVLALAIVAHNFSSALGADTLQLLLTTVAQLTTTPSREIVAACLVYLKIHVSSVPTPVVAHHLPDIVRALTAMTQDCQRHFRLRVRDLLDKLMRKFGSEAVAAHVPPSDVTMFKRLRNLRKLHERRRRHKEEARRDAADSDEPDEFAVRAAPRSMAEILADSDSASDSDEQGQRAKRKGPETWIQEDADDIVDFTDPSAARRITATRPAAAASTAPGIAKKNERGFKTASDGRLIIQDDSDDSDDGGRKARSKKLVTDSESEDDYKSAAETAVLGGTKKRKRADTESVASAPAMKYKAGGSGIHRPLGPGAEFRSKKAGGDVKRKGATVDPYAYLPLSRQLLNKRNRTKNSGQFKTVVSRRGGAKRGRGSKKRT